MRTKKSAILPAGYSLFLAELKARIRTVQTKAAAAVNRELILLYWHLGQKILLAQKTEGWGAGIVTRMAEDLADEFPDMGGFSERNLAYMLAFVEAWTPGSILQQPVAELKKSFRVPASKLKRRTILQQPVAKLAPQSAVIPDAPPEPLAQLPWSTNLILLHKLKEPKIRLWYAHKSVAHGWSRSVLSLQIESRLHERSGKAITNFDRTLPPAQSDLAREVLKDPYTFDFLVLGEAARERDLEHGLVRHVQQLLLELGAGFAFVGRQVHLQVGDEDFYLDLLFYHLRLRCFIIVDLKMKPFEPEFAGKMNFYLSAVDDQMRHPQDASTIGLLLCKDAKNKLKVEYALRDVKKPIGVAEWQTRLVESLPRKLQGSLPTIADIERELNRSASSRSKSKSPA